MIIQIGFTTGHLRDAAGGDYIPALDGYREGVAQTVVHVAISDGLVGDATLEQIAEAVFEATNAPFEVTGLAAEIRTRIERRVALGAAGVRPLSVGDTVGSKHLGRVACASTGWSLLP